MSTPSVLTAPPATAPATSRRSVLRRGAAVGAVGAAASVAGVVATSAPASAATSYVPAHYKGAPLLSASGLHLVNRFSYGVTPALTAAVAKAGGAGKWFLQQLAPSQVADPAADKLQAWWPSLGQSAQSAWQRQIRGIEDGWLVESNYQRWLLMRRITTNRQLAEVMTELWMNHLNVPVHADASFTYRFDYDRVVRSHALGKFSDLLNAAIVHPAMGMYLDNAVSTKDHPNENLGRELLELHTVGIGHYSEDDVKSSARILTGYVVDMWDTWNATYSPRDHWTGAVKVMGFSHANTAADGRAVTTAYLTYLAHHRATAERIATKLAVKFVSDTPSAALIKKLADVYQANDTAIVPVLKALIATAEFQNAGAKVRDPCEDVVATYRVLGCRLSKPTGEDDDDSACMNILWQADGIGQAPHDWPRPDGQPIDNASWSSPARLMASTNVHWSMSGGWWPTHGIVYRTPVQWLPAKSVRFDVLVDSLSQRLLGRRSTAKLLKACCEVCGVHPSTTINGQSDVVKWKFHRLLSTFLDSPYHLTR